MYSSAAVILLFYGTNLVFGVYAETTTQTETASSASTAPAPTKSSSDPKTQLPQISESSVLPASDDPKVGENLPNKGTTPNQIQVIEENNKLPEKAQGDGIPNIPSVTSTTPSSKTTHKSSAASLRMGVFVLVPSFLALILSITSS